MHKFLSGGGRGLSTGGKEGSVNSRHPSDPISDLEWRVEKFKTLGGRLTCAGRTVARQSCNYLSRNKRKLSFDNVRMIFGTDFVSCVARGPDRAVEVGVAVLLR